LTQDIFTLVFFITLPILIVKYHLQILNLSFGPHHFIDFFKRLHKVKLLFSYSEIVLLERRIVLKVFEFIQHEPCYNPCILNLLTKIFDFLIFLVFMKELFEFFVHLQCLEVHKSSLKRCTYLCLDCVVDDNIELLLRFYLLIEDAKCYITKVNHNTRFLVEKDLLSQNMNQKYIIFFMKCLKITFIFVYLLSDSISKRELWLLVKQFKFIIISFEHNLINLTILDG
jgi:hypothetical protein